MCIMLFYVSFYLVFLAQDLYALTLSVFQPPFFDRTHWKIKCGINSYGNLDRFP